MSLILNYLCVHQGKIKRSSLEALSRSREVADANGHEVVALVLGPEVAAHAAKRLPTYARPRRIVFMDEFPRTRTDKVDRKALSDRLA